MWQVTRDMWHMTCDMLHMTCDTWQIVWYEYSLQISALYLFRFRIDSVSKIFEMKDDSMNEWATEVIVEHPWLHRVC